MVLIIPILGLTSCVNPAKSSGMAAGSFSVIEKQIEVTGRPVFKNQGDEGTTLEIVGSSKSGELLMYWPDDGPAYGKLDLTKTYRFELLESSIPTRDGETRKVVELLRMSSDVRLICDTSKCGVHGRSMTRQKMQDGEDLELLGERYFKVQTRFPNSGQRHPACDACIARYQGNVWVCPDCQKDEKKWVATHLLH